MDFDRIVEFVGNHPLLIISFLGVLGLLIATEVSRRLSGMKSIGASEATQLSNRENAVFLDIRDEGERKSGHIPESIHIPLKHLPGRVSELDKYKDRPIIAYCRSGTRSTGAGSILRKQGFEKVYNLAGGILGWEKANLPVSTR